MPIDHISASSTTFSIGNLSRKEDQTVGHDSVKPKLVGTGFRGSLVLEATFKNKKPKASPTSSAPAATKLPKLRILRAVAPPAVPSLHVSWAQHLADSTLESSTTEVVTSGWLIRELRRYQTLLMTLKSPFSYTFITSYPCGLLHFDDFSLIRFNEQTIR